MKRFVAIFLTLVMVMILPARTYDALWKQVNASIEKDTPKTTLELLSKISDKAIGEKKYGHLIKAMTMQLDAYSEISADSVPGFIEKVNATDSMLEKNDIVACWLLRIAMYEKTYWRIFLPASNALLQDYRSHRNRNASKSLVEELLSDESTKDLVTAPNSALQYSPLIESNKFMEKFGNNIISYIANAMDDFKPLADYFTNKGNKVAACVCTARYLSSKEHHYYSDSDKKQAINEIDSAMNIYGDIKEGCLIAIAKMTVLEDIHRYKDNNKEIYEFLNDAIARWGKWDIANPLRDKLDDITAPKYNIDSDAKLAYPVEHQLLYASIRNIKDLTITATPVEGIDNKTLESVTSIDDLKKYLKAGKARTITHHFDGHEPYETFKDTIDLGNVPVGIYVLQMKADGKVIGDTPSLLMISNLRVIAMKLDKAQTRYVVVNATTGKPVSGAMLHLKDYRDNHISFTTDEKGEFILNSTDSHPYVAATTNDDKAQRMWHMWTDFNSEEARTPNTIHQIYTDRSIYRPGHTVHASVMAYDIDGKAEIKAAANKNVSIKLMDANYKNIATKEVTTNEFGVAAADFDLPKSGLNGRWWLEVNDGRTSFRVEEYVRPTFDVEIVRPETAYGNGDTITVKGKAKAYSGAPVMNAKVSYEVRRKPVWWFRFFNHDLMERIEEELEDATIITDADGSFAMKVPMILPDCDDEFVPLFCNIEIEATVTDIAGETHSASLTLPLGNKKTFVTTNLGSEILADKPVKYIISRYNNAGTEIEGKMNISIDGKDVGSYDANKEITLPEDIASGKHKLVAVCENDTLEHSFCLFRKTDERPVTDTKDWWYQSCSVFDETDNDPVFVQFGTMEKDVYAVYTILANNKVIESGSVMLDSSNVTKEFAYKPEYSNGLSYSVAWIKNGEIYTHTANIKRRLPEKKLEMKWMTFRNRLTPGQKEEWKLSVNDKEGKGVAANVMATLYDKSLDAIYSHGWRFHDVRSINHTRSQWGIQSIYGCHWKGLQTFKARKMSEEMLDYLFGGIAKDELKSFKGHSITVRGKSMMNVNNSVMMAAPTAVMEMKVGAQRAMDMEDGAALNEVATNNGNDEDNTNISMRENLNETAFFMPLLRTDDEGVATLSFTLPESVTTWKLIALANDKDMRHEIMTDEVVAQKELMIQPRLPRFVREGDKVSLPASVTNLSDKDLNVKVKVTLLDAETEDVLLSDTRKITVKGGEAGAVTFSFNSEKFGGKMLICKMTAEGGNHSDGEQHYLPVLSGKECVMDTRTLVINTHGTTSVNVGEMIPESAGDARMTVEYTDAPEWLLVQSMPYIAETNDDNAISLVTAYFTNTIAAKMMNSNPKIKETIAAWAKDEEAMKSALSKNEELRQIILNETPWMSDAKNEAERKSMLYKLFDEKMLAYRSRDIVERLSKLQNSDGAWSWWKGMSGSRFITEEVLKTLLRMNRLAGEQKEAKALISRSFNYLDNEVAKDVKEMKKREKKGDKVYISDMQLNYLYCHAINTGDVSDIAKANIRYLKEFVKEATDKTDMLSKAMTALILHKYGKTNDATDYLESIRQHTVYREDMGRYFDSKRARYSWCDYKIPTQVMAIEALKALAPDDVQTINEMQRWLLQSKRTQAWDTPVNAVNAIYAFLGGNNAKGLHEGEAPRISLDERQLSTSPATQALGYVKAAENVKAGIHSLTIEKKSEGESWANIFMQYTVPSTEVTNASTGIKVERKISANSSKVGDRVTITITITADRDYDFVTVTDNRSACLEPVNQLSGYRYGYYQVMRDSQSQYHFDMLSKGTHEIKTEYYVSREGEYTSGIVSAQCAYAPEFCGREKGIVMKVE